MLVNRGSLIYLCQIGRGTTWFFRSASTGLLALLLLVAPQHAQAGASYVPVTGDFNGDSYDDIFWYGPGSILDSIWFGRFDGEFDKTNDPIVHENPTPVAGDADGNGCVDVADDQVIIDNFGTNTTKGDLNSDGTVNFLDRLIVIQNVGAGC